MNVDMRGFIPYISSPNTSPLYLSNYSYSSLPYLCIDKIVQYLYSPLASLPLGRDALIRSNGVVFAAPWLKKTDTTLTECGGREV